MRQSTRLLVNSAVNVFARLVTVVSRLILVPFAVGVLGRSAYGTWVVVGQIFAYTRVFEIGLRAAVTRQVALRIERDEHELLHRHVNTAAAYYSLVGVLIAGVTVALCAVYNDWFEVPPAWHGATRGMVLVSGLTLALTIPTYAYGAVLAGLQRFDLLSGTQIGADVLRLALVLALLPMFD
ncbi:MAG: hypothetical protein D6788_00895, partial [Planctomycetota bacterium]